MHECADVGLVRRFHSEFIVIVEVVADEFSASQEDDEACLQGDGVTLSYANPHAVGDVVKFNSITRLTDEIEYAISQWERRVLSLRYVLDQM